MARTKAIVMHSERKQQQHRVVQALVALLIVSATTVGGAAACGAAILASVALGVPPLPALVLGGVFAVGVGWAGSLRWRHSPRAPMWTAGMVTIALAASAVMLVPTPGKGVTPTGLALSDGARMPVRVYERPGDQAPIVAVHGGPGIPFTEADERALLDAVPDRTVVTYDQVGSGGASRLGHPSRYTAERAVADLAAVVESTKASRVVLVGYSDGAGIAAAYAADHSERVAGLVMISPGTIALPETRVQVYGPQSRLGTRESLALYSVALRPRNLFMYLMTSTDPDAAHAFGGDAEMDSRYRQLLSLAAGGLHCRGSSHPTPVFPTGPPGHYLNQVRQYRPAALDEAGIARIRSIPVLVLRGECDYIPHEVVDQISTFLPEARLVDVDDSGHAMFEDRPDHVRAVLSSFLAEEVAGGAAGPHS